MSPAIIDRRQFVLLGSFTVAGLASGFPLLASSERPLSFVSIGHHPGATRSRVVRPAAGGSLPFRSANSILSGDPTMFRHGARLRLHDFHRAVRPANGERLAIDVLYSVEGLPDAVPFHAWSALAGRNADENSSSIAFNVPVESVGAVKLAFERRPAGDPGAVERVEIPFAVNDLDTPAVRLISGIYAIAFLRAGDHEPDWSSIRPDRVLGGTSRPVTLIQDSFSGIRPLSFDYILLSVSRRTAPHEQPASLEDGIQAVPVD
jgi:hypothetical protein